MRILFRIFVLFCLCVNTLQAKTNIELLSGTVVLGENKLTYKQAHLRITTKIDIWEIIAQQIYYDTKEHQMLMQGDVVMKSDNIEINAYQILLDTNSGLVEVEKGTIFDKRNKIQITAKQILQKEKHTYSLKKAFLTSCVVGADSASQTWKIYSDNLDYFVDNYALGVNNIFYLKNIPVLYSPVISWPTSPKRKSGFLAPRLSYNDLPQADSYGLQIKIPYFWAIDPYTNYTLGFDLRQKRGIALQSEFHKTGKQKPQETIMDLWYLPEIISKRQENNTNVLPVRYLIDVFYYELFKENSNLFLRSYLASDSRIAEDYQLALVKNNQIYRENKLFLDFRWKNGSVYLRAKQNQEFADELRRAPSLEQSTAWGDLRLEHNYFSKHLQARIVENLEQFSLKKGWSGLRQISELDSDFVFKNDFFFVKPHFSYNHRFYQAKNTAGVLANRDFQYQYLSFDFKTGLDFIKKTKTGKWDLQTKIDYQKIPKTNALRNFAADLHQNHLTLDLLDKNTLNEPLFDTKDIVLPKEITKFSLRLAHRDQENSLALELTTIYDFLSKQTTTDSGDYLFILPKNRENSYSLEQYWLPLRFLLQWRFDQNFGLDYFARQDTRVGKNLEQNWKMIYKKLSLTAENNKQTYTNYDGENFFEKKQLTFTAENQFLEKWTSGIIAKKNYLFSSNYDNAYFLGNSIDDLTLSLQYKDCCSEIELSFFEKSTKAKTTRGVALNFNLISGF